MGAGLWRGSARIAGVRLPTGGPYAELYGDGSGTTNSMEQHLFDHALTLSATFKRCKPNAQALYSVAQEQVSGLSTALSPSSSSPQGSATGSAASRRQRVKVRLWPCARNLPLSASNERLGPPTLAA